MENRKQPTEAEILTEIQHHDWGLPPLEIQVDAPVRKGNKLVDAILKISWNGKRYRFGAKIKGLWTPKSVQLAVDQVLRDISPPLHPLIVIPFLGEKPLRELERRGVSGIDLCGNGVVIVPGELLVFRSGSPNRFRWEGRIKNVYRGTSAIVARMFLINAEFSTVGDCLRQIRERGGEMTLPTVSKVCQSLEDDLVIERGPGETPNTRKLRLIQLEKLLELLRENYVGPVVTRTLSGKFAERSETLMERFLAWEKETAHKVVRTGASSVDAYAVMAREPIEVFYCSNLASLRKSLGNALTETERFPTVRLLETKDDSVFFDRRPGLVASPVQTYLELATGEKREKETSDQVRRFLLQKTSEPNSARW